MFFRSKIFIMAASASVIVLIVLLLVFLIPSNSSLTPSSAPMGEYQNAAVVANGYLCATVGKDVLLEGGNAVDAAIALAVCDGVMNIQSSGIGGGSLITIYLKSQEKVMVLNSRETAPAAATVDMYGGNSTLSQFGGLSVAVPGELKGLSDLYDKLGSGKIKWSRLIEPSIKICQEGYNVTLYQEGVFLGQADRISTNPGLREILWNPSTNMTLKEGDLLKQSRLANTLSIVAAEGASAIYNGSLTDTLVKEIQDAGGIITRKDLEDYRPMWMEPVSTKINDYVLHSVPLPGAGVVLSFILNLLSIMLPADNEVVSAHRIIESFKYGYALRAELGDIADGNFVPNVTAVQELANKLTSLSYAENIRALIRDNETHNDPRWYGSASSLPEDHGTAHMAVLAPNGDAVALTSTINQVLGSQFVSPSTGILLNDEMDDFSSPSASSPSPANFIYPGKRPLSSMCPSIALDKNGDVALLTGAAGGIRITSSTAFIALQNLILKKSIKDAIDTPRLHHQLNPMEVSYEDGISNDVVEGLQKIGHVLVNKTPSGSSSTGIARNGNVINAVYDFRRGGSIAGF